MGSFDAPEVTVRAAETTEIDAAAFARLLDQAQARWFSMALGADADRLIRSVYPEANHDLSYEFVTIVEREATPVAMASAYPGWVHRGFTSHPLDNAARGRLRYRTMSKLSGRVLSFMANIPDDDFYLRALAVDPTHRGQGIGTLLMDTVIEAARTAGCKRLALDVAASNKAARRLYERIGMVQETESPRFLGLPNTNVLRMVRDL